MTYPRLKATAITRTRCYPCWTACLQHHWTQSIIICPIIIERWAARALRPKSPHVRHVISLAMSSLCHKICSVSPTITRGTNRNRCAVIYEHHCTRRRGARTAIHHTTINCGEYCSTFYVCNFAVENQHITTNKTKQLLQHGFIVAWRGVWMGSANLHPHLILGRVFSHVARAYFPCMHEHNKRDIFRSCDGSPIVKCNLQLLCVCVCTYECVLIRLYT